MRFVKIISSARSSLARTVSLSKLGKKKTFLLWRDGLFSSLLCLGVSFLISFIFFNTSFFNPLSKALEDFSFLDVYYSERLDEKQVLDPNIILLNIEQENRFQIAEALKATLQENPKVVGFDIILGHFEKTPTDTVLRDFLNHKKVVSAYKFQGDETLENHPFFKGKGSSGYVDFNFGYQDAVIREFTPFYTQNQGLDTAFTVQLARRVMTGQEWQKKRMTKKLSSSRVINYTGDYDRFMYFTLSEFLALQDKSVVTNKVVLFGYLGVPTGNTFDVEDKHFTPLNKITAGKSLPDMYGMVVHANILAMLVSDHFMYKVSNRGLVFLTFLFSFLASVYFIWLDKRLKLSYRTVRKALLFVFGVFMVWITLLLFKWGIVLKSAPIIAVTVFSAGFIKYYKHLVGYIKTKRKFKSYI